MNAKSSRSVSSTMSDTQVAVDTTDTASRHSQVRRSVLARSLAVVLAVVSWVGPVQISWQAARQSAATIASRSAADALSDLMASWRITGQLLVRWGAQQAEAAPITDPTAPIRFTPTITQTTGTNGGVPVMNITTPNGAGISLNQLRSLTVDAIGLVMNNSLTGGGTFLGGSVSGNPNLASSGPASTIITQVTGTAPIRINGTVEVFGAPASVIFAAPAGIYLAGAGFTNSPNVTLVTGTPQFLNSSGSQVGFDQATAVGYTVNSGRVQIDPVAGTTNGAGIEGTVGSLNLIGQSIGVNAALYAGQQINAIAGNQQVTPVATGTGRAGSDWQVTSTGQNNAANSPSAQNGVAIDATAFGALTAGQIKLISTAQGLAVKAVGDMAANTGNVNIDSNGNVTVGNVYGQQNVGIVSTGAVSTTGTVKAQQDVSVSATGDVNVGGPAQAGNNLTLNAGGNLAGAGNLAATNALSATAANSANLTGNLNANTIAVTAQGKDGTGDLTLGGNVSAPGAIALSAARDTTVAGQLTGGNTTSINSGRNLSVAGAIGSVGDLTLTATSGTLSTTGTVTTQGNLNASAGQDVSLGGTTTADGNATINAAAGSITTAGTLNAAKNIALTAGQNATLGGATQAGGTLNVTAGNTVSGAGSLTATQTIGIQAGGSIGINGDVSANQIAMQAAGHDGIGDITLGGNVSAPGTIALSAARDTTVTGSVVSDSDLNLATQRNLTVGGTVGSTTGSVSLTGRTGSVTTNGAVITPGNLTVNSGTDTNLGGLVSAAGTATVNAGNNLTTAGQIGSNGTLTLNAGQNLTVGGQVGSGVDANLQAGNAVAVNGALSSTGNTSVIAGQSIAVAGDIAAGGNATLNATQTVTGAGNLSAAQTTSVTAGSIDLGGKVSGNQIALTANGTGTLGDVHLGGTVSAPGSVSISATRDATLDGGAVAGTDLTATAGRNVSVNGTAASVGGNVNLSAQTGQLSGTGSVVAYKGNVNASAAQNLTVGGAVYAGKDATLASQTGSTTVSGNLASLGKTSITSGQNTTLTGQVQTGGDLQASAGKTLAVGQLSYVGGNATLRGADITVGSLANQANVVQGTLDAVATNSLTLTGNSNAANLNLGGTTINNQGSTLATQQATVSGGTLSNTGTLAANQLTINATDVVNRGTVGGQTVNLNASNSIDNVNGLVVGAHTLNVTTNTLKSNQGGTFYAGDLTGQSPTTGNMTFTVNGGAGSFNNARGQLLAGNNLTVNTPNQAFDPSAAATGTLNANNAVTLSVQSINNTQTWNVQGSNVAINAAQGITNSGTIQKAGDLSLSTAGTLANSGQIVGGSNVSLSAGNLTNSGTIHADGNLALAGNIQNSGTAEALGNITISGSNYDNRGGKTQANGDIKFDLSGTLNNVASTIGANGNIHIAAQNVINDRGAPVDAGSSFSKVLNDTLLNSTVIGSYAPWVSTGSCDSCSSAYVPGTTTNLTIGDLARTTDGAAVQLAVGYIGVYSGGGDNGASLSYVQAWHLLPTGTQTSGSLQTQTVALPTVDRTIISQADGAAGQIVAGKAMDITAASLSNKGGLIQAAGNVTLNVGALDNGRSATLVSSVTDTVNANDYAAFISQLQNIGQSAPGSLQYGQPQGYPSSCDSCTAPVPTASQVTLNQDATGATTSAPTQSTVTQTLGKAGQILSGGNLSLTGTGDLVNAGDLAAARKVTITTPGAFTNQGSYISQITTTPGCLPGAVTCKEANPHVDTLNWQQTPNTVAAGDTLTINAANIQNNNGTLAAVGNVTLTATNGLTNKSGAIQSTAGDITISAPTVVNTTMAPVTLHKSYGNMNPSYAGGCNAGGTYKSSQCESDEMTQAGPAGVISAARDVNLSGTTLTNTGALITGGRNVTVNMAGGVNNSSIALNANWHGEWVEERGMFSSDVWHYTNGVAVLGNLASGIQAGNALSVTSGGQVLNTGNLLGSAVDVTGAALTNGITSPNQPTPPTVAGQQVISLAPPAGPTGALPTASTAGSGPTAQSSGSTPSTSGASGGAPQANVAPVQAPVWSFQPAIVTAPSAPGSTQVSWHFNAPVAGSTLTAPTSSVNGATYVNGTAATSVLAGVTPNALLSQLPANLQPGSTPFYYDPFAEDQKLQQAALQQTGQNSFISGLTYDSQNQLSVTDQEKLILYKAAADYAKTHNIQLGQALTQQQIAELDKPMLWYVTQQVPDPNCNTVASTACPTIAALVPQLYLPAGYADSITQPAGGTIAGQNVNLNVDGTLRNSGQIMAGDTLNVKAGTIDNAPNVVDIGTSAYKVEGGWLQVTGTQVQPGGFMSAVNLNVTANAINAINDAFIVRNADGTTNQAATDALIAQMKSNLGLGYTSGTAKDDIHQDFIKEQSGFGPLGQVIAIAVAIALSIVTAGAGAAVLAAVGSTLTGTAAAMAGAAISAAISGTLSSMVSQVILTGSLNLGAALKSGAISAVTAGLTAGATSALNLNGAGVNSIGDNISKGDWTAFQANIGQYAEASVVRSAISAGVNTIAYGGSFGQAFAGGLVRDAAAVGANAVGVEAPGIGADGATPGTIFANALGHALVGCAAASLTSGDCAGGAIGGAASALAAPVIRDQVYADSPVLNYSDDAGRQALTVALSTMIGGALGAALGHDATVAANAAQNEALNNATSRYQNVKDPRFQSNVAALGQCVGDASCRSNAAFLEKQINVVLSDAQIAGMCGGNADCVSARLQERALYQQAYGQAITHLDAGVAARDYLTAASQRAGAGYTTSQLDDALKRFRAGTADLANPLDKFVATTIAGNIALFGAVKGVTAVDSDGGGSGRRPGNAAREITNPVLEQPRVGYGEKGQGSGNKVDQTPNRKVTDGDGNPIPIYADRVDGPTAVQEFPGVPKAHGFSDIIDNYAGAAQQITLSNGAKLYQLEGSLNGVAGRYEWIVDPRLGGVTHRMFVPGGKINGVPSKP
ncbi:beta strand repeat-containing protein [Ralstonia pseudosolanacearum]|uniref:beta strand repeat-containing protein n=1 Tax=Ralstonia pseudosolanacearum TaxID=1310165 RepID=UPI001FFB42A1|nr:hemagglutinin [Ralstonia pseudosolanacearum]